jgi:hypothetical protein
MGGIAAQNFDKCMLQRYSSDDQHPMSYQFQTRFGGSLPHLNTDDSRPLLEAWLGMISGSAASCHGINSEDYPPSLSLEAADENG